MFENLEHGLKIAPKPATWANLLTLRGILSGQIEHKVDKILTKMMSDEEMVEAVRGHMQVSDRYAPTRRDGFNYLAHTYKASVETGTNLSDWTCVLEVWPDEKALYIRPILGGAVAELGSLINQFQGGKTFCLPGRTREQTKYRQNKWQQLFAMWDKPLPIAVCTVESFGEYAGKVV